MKFFDIIINRLDDPDRYQFIGIDDDKGVQLHIGTITLAADRMAIRNTQPSYEAGRLSYSPDNEEADF